MRTNSRRALLPITLIALLLTVAPSANANGDIRAETPVDREVAAALAAEPGGYATSAHTAYWPELDMTLTSSLADDSTNNPVVLKAVGSCANGSVCAYSKVSLTGAKLSWTTCGTHSTSALATVRSIANGRSSGTLKARNGTTVLATASAGGQSNVVGNVTNVNC